MAVAGQYGQFTARLPYIVNGSTVAPGTKTPVDVTYRLPAATAGDGVTTASALEFTNIDGTDSIKVSFAGDVGAPFLTVKPFAIKALPGGLSTIWVEPTANAPDFEITCDANKFRAG